MGRNLVHHRKETRKLIGLMKSHVKNWHVGETLKIHKPNGRVLYPAVFMLVGLGLLGELIFSQSVVQKHLLGPKIGSRHEQFEVQWARLEKLVREGEKIDCIFLGNSMIWIDVDPLVVSQEVESKTGQEMNCFNFGVSTLTASSAGLIAPVLVERYHPKYLIYGTFARDYAIPATAEDTTVVSETPWLKYQSGKFNLTGWLYDHSSFYQYKNYVPDLLFMNFREVIPRYDGWPTYREYGFDSKHGMRIDVQKSPDLDEIGSKDPHKWLYQYRVFTENLEGLQAIARQADEGVKIVVIEMPFYPMAFKFFLNGKEDYNEYIKQISAITESSGIPFWRLDEQPNIPAEDWWDYFHMNINGAQLFSEWLGNRLSEVILQESQTPVPSIQ